MNLCETLFRFRDFAVIPFVSASDNREEWGDLIGQLKTMM